MTPLDLTLFAVLIAAVTSFGVFAAIELACAAASRFTVDDTDAAERALAAGRLTEARDEADAAENLR